MKNYQYKHYDKDFNFIKVINPNTIKNEVVFSEAINAPQGQLSIDLKEKWEEVSFTKGDIIVVRASNEFFPNGYVIYTGYIEEIQKQKTNFDGVSLNCVGVGALLTKVRYKSGSNYIFTQNTKPHTILNNILDYFETQYPGIIQKGLIAEINEDLNIEFDYDDCFTAIKKITDTYNETHFFFIDRNGFFQFKEKESVTQHRLNFQKDLQSLIQNQELDITNRLHLIYDGGVAIYEDTTSQGLYGLYENVIRDSSIKNLATANEFGNNYIARNANPISETNLEVNDKYEIVEYAVWDDSLSWDDLEDWIEIFGGNKFEGIQIGDKIRVQNIQETITGIVAKKDYSRDRLRINLGKFENFISLIKE